MNSVFYINIIVRVYVLVTANVMHGMEWFYHPHSAK